MKFFCFIPWFFNQIRPKFAEVKKHILSEENYDICLLKTIENHFWTTKTYFSLCWNWISLSKLVLTKTFKGKCSLVCRAVRGSVLNEVDIKPGRVKCWYFSNYELGRTQCSESWSDPNPKTVRRNANKVICWQTKSSKKKSLLADPFSEKKRHIFWENLQVSSLSGKRNICSMGGDENVITYKLR